ncbi:MAG TPA: YfhO family protein, partial [Anaerolineales bacterium]|nr:YfhO family protein [Anaerolineales bacterium]
LLLIEPARGHGFLVLLHLLWTAAGTVLLTRRLGVGALGQVVAAQAWSLSTYLVSRSGFFSLNAAAAWLPWILLYSHRLGSEISEGWRPGKRLWILLPLSATIAFQLLAGHAQTSWYSLTLAIVMTVIPLGAEARDFLRAAGAWLMAVAMSLILAAGQILPTLEYMLESTRAGGLDAASALTYSFWPWRALGLLLPGLFGSPATGDFWGYGNYWEDAMYVGVLPLLMALMAVTRLGRLGRHRRPAIFLASAAALAFLLSLGSNTPLYMWLYRAIPLFQMFNAPTRWNILTTMCLAILAGIGAEAWAPPTPRGRYWKRLSVAGALALAAVAFVIGSRVDLPGLQPSMARAFALLGILFAATAVLQLRWPGQADRTWITIVAIVIGADLLIANAGLLPSTSIDLYTTSTSLKSEVDDGHRLYLPAALDYDIKFDRTHRFDTFDPGIDWLDVRQAGLPNTPMIEGLPSANNFDPLLGEAYVDWIDRLEASGLDPRLLTLADIGWLGQPTGDTPAWVKYRAVSGAERVRIVPEAKWTASREESLELAAGGSIDFESIVVLEGEPDPARSGSYGSGSAEVIPQGDPNLVRVRASAPDGGWLLLSDSWYPGWIATVDGQDTTIHRADGLFRAVWTPPGEHEILFAYRPPIFGLAILLSGVAWALVLALGLRWQLD